MFKNISLYKISRLLNNYDVYKILPYSSGLLKIDPKKPENNYYNYSNDDTDYGNLYKSATEHPDGATDLYSDGNGVLHGSFFIPSTSSIFLLP